MGLLPQLWTFFKSKGLINEKKKKNIISFFALALGGLGGPGFLKTFFPQKKLFFFGFRGVINYLGCFFFYFFSKNKKNFATKAFLRSGFGGEILKKKKQQFTFFWSFYIF